MKFYAIKLNFIGDDDFYVHHDSGKCETDMSPILFESYQSANLYASSWIDKCPSGFVSIVEYEV